MPWKTSAEGVLATIDGKPVWVNDAGEEKPFDYAAFSKRLADTTRESVERKEKLRVLESRYAKLKDIEDLDAWYDESVKARDMMNHADDAKKAQEEQIRARVEASTKPLLEKLKAAESQIAELTASLQKETVSNAFSRSAYVKDKLVSDKLAADLFSSRFIVRDGKLVALDEAGKDLYGSDGGLATFDEAIQHFVTGSPYKDTLLKGNGATGSGANPNISGGYQPGSKNPWAKESWSETRQMQIASEDPQLAMRLAGAAGIKLNL